METEMFSCPTGRLEYELRRMSQQDWHQLIVTIDGNTAEVIAIRMTQIAAAGATVDE